MSPHIDAPAGAIAPVVLLPGDPLRAQAIAERWFTDARCYNRVRGALGFTGTYHGRRVSVQGTGMGMPSASIYIHELVRDHGARALIRVGTCGAIQERLALGDVVIAMSASTDSGMNRRRFGGLDFAPAADFDLLHAAHRVALERGVRVAVGGVASSDFFYDDQPDSWRLWARYGVLALEMETAELYTVAAREGVRALSLLTVSDHVIRGEAITPAERETTLHAMVEIALEAALGGAVETP